MTNYPRDYSRKPSAKERTIARRNARRVKQRTWLTLLTAATMTQACSNDATWQTPDAPAVTSYAVVIVTKAGNASIADYGLTADDCPRALSRAVSQMSEAQWQRTRSISCEVE